MTPDYWERAKTELSAADEVMAAIIAQYKGETMQTRGDAFYTLARSIVGQQISVKAADSVWNKLESCLKTVKTGVLLSKTEDELRLCGLSGQKVKYLYAIAEYFEKHSVTDNFFNQYSDEEAINFLIEIKGVGRWTAEMFLMFHLMRPNMLPVDDIGLQKGIEKHYDLQRNADKKLYYSQIRELAEQWQPWQSVATWYLWRSLDPLPVAY